VVGVGSVLYHFVSALPVALIPQQVLKVAVLLLFIAGSRFGW
jgi:hypothetical protein